MTEIINNFISKIDLILKYGVKGKSGRKKLKHYKISRINPNTGIIEHRHHKPGIWYWHPADQKHHEERKEFVSIPKTKKEVEFEDYWRVPSSRQKHVHYIGSVGKFISHPLDEKHEKENAQTIHDHATELEQYSSKWRDISWQEKYRVKEVEIPNGVRYTSPKADFVIQDFGGSFFVSRFGSPPEKKFFKERDAVEYIRPFFEEKIIVKALLQKAKSGLLPIRTFVHYPSGITRSAIRWKNPESIGLKNLKVRQDLVGIMNLEDAQEFSRDSIVRQTLFYLSDNIALEKIYENEFLPLEEHEVFGDGLYLYNDIEKAKEVNNLANKVILPVKIWITNPYILRDINEFTPEIEDKVEEMGYDSIIIMTNEMLKFDVFCISNESIRIIGAEEAPVQKEVIYKSEEEEVVIDISKAKLYPIDIESLSEDDKKDEVLAKAIITTPQNEDGSVDYKKIPIGQTVWVTVKDPGSPLVGRPILITKRPDGLFALTGGSGFRHFKDKYGIETRADALRHLVMTGIPKKTKRDIELEEIASETEKFNEPLIEKRKELMAYGKKEIQEAYDEFNKAVGIEAKLTANELKKQRDNIVQYATDSGLDEEEAHMYSTSLIRSFAAGERQVVEQRRRDVGLKCFTRLREMKELSPEELKDQLGSLNSELQEFGRPLKIDLPNPGMFKGLTQEQMEGKIGDYIGERVTDSLNPNPLDKITDDELHHEGIKLEDGEKDPSIQSIELGAGIKPLEIKDVDSLKNSVDKFRKYHEVKSEINAVKKLLKKKPYDEVTPAILQQMKIDVQATFPEISDSELMEITQSYSDEAQKNNSAISFYSAISDFWSDEKSLRETLGRADNSFGEYVNSGATSALAALSGKFLGRRIEANSLIDKTNVETAALVVAFSVRDELQKDLPKYNAIIRQVEKLNAENQIKTEKMALAQHKSLKDKYATIVSEEEKGTLTSEAFLLDAKISNLIEQKKNLGTALGSLQSSAAFLQALMVARDAKDNAISIDFGEDVESAQLRLNELNVGHRGDINVEDPKSVKVVTNARSLQKYLKSIDVIKENYDKNEKLKTNTENVFEAEDGRIYAKDYKVPLWKDTFVDADGNEHKHNFRIEQRNDIEFLKESGGGVITRVTGAGKTNTSLGFFANKISEDKTYSALAVVPKGRVKQWIDEAKRFTDLNIVEIPEGLNKDDRTAIIAKIKPGQFAAMSHRDAAVSYYTLEAAVYNGLFKGLAIDEPQELASRSISGNMSAPLRKIMKLPTENRIALTATPARDNLVEAYDLVNWASHHDKGLGPRTRFQRIYGGYGSGTNAQDVTLQQMIHKEISPFISGDRITNPDFKVKQEAVLVRKTSIQSDNMKNLEKTADKYIKTEGDKFIKSIESNPEELQKWERRYGRAWKSRAGAKASKTAKDKIMSFHNDNLGGIYGNMKWTDNPKLSAAIEHIKNNKNQKHVVFLDNPSQRKSLIEGLVSIGFKTNQLKNIASTTMSDRISGAEMAKRVSEFRRDKDARIIFIDKQSSSGYNLQEGNVLHVLGTPSDAATYLQAQGRLARMPRIGDVIVRTYKYEDVPFEDQKWTKIDNQIKILRAAAPGMFMEGK